MESLLQLPLDPDLADVFGHTALAMAAMKGNVAVVRLLLEAGADKDTTIHNHGYTALMLAAARGHLECVRLLLDAGADREKASRNGKTAAMLASTFGRLECVRLLSGGADAADKELAANSGSYS